MAPATTLTLNDGRQIPMLAFGSGSAQLRSKRAKGGVEIDSDIVFAVKNALREGFRHLDCAETYGTEVEVGIAIRESLEEGVIRNREELFITSKVLKNPIVEAGLAVDRALDRLGPAAGGYVDLFLIHWPYFASSDADLQSAWAAMERIQASGKVRSIGVSNYERSHLDAILATARIPPAINQTEFSPYMTQRGGGNFLANLRDSSQGISVSAYGMLRPVTGRIPGPLDDVLAGLAAKYSVGTGVICLRWAIEQNVVVITTSQKVERMREYFRAFDFSLEEDEVREISEAGLVCVQEHGEVEPITNKYKEGAKKAQ